MRASKQRSQEPRKLALKDGVHGISTTSSSDKGKRNGSERARGGTTSKLQHKASFLAHPSESLTFLDSLCNLESDVFLNPAASPDVSTS